MTTDAKLHTMRHSHIYPDVPVFMRPSEEMVRRPPLRPIGNHARLPWTCELEEMAYKMREAGADWGDIAIELEARTGILAADNSVMYHMQQEYGDI